jgi:ABC-type bacteriocin/lantibiotic exporter with double-glycine peptidase domain
MNKKKKYALVGLIVLVLIVAALIVIGWKFHNSEKDDQYAFWKTPGEYLGNYGVVFQMNTNECGPCALKMIFDYYDIPISLKKIETGITLTEKGTSMLDLKKIAERNGLKAEGWRFTFDDFMRSSFPSILYVNNNHFIVADSVRQDTVYFRNPAMGRMKIGKNELCEIWKGETLVFKESK